MCMHACMYGVLVETHTTDCRACGVRHFLCTLLTKRNADTVSKNPQFSH